MAEKLSPGARAIYDQLTSGPSTAVEDLTPVEKALFDYFRADARDANRKYAEYIELSKLTEAATASSTPRSTSTPHVPTSATAAAAPDPSAAPVICSPVCLNCDTGSTSTVSIPAVAPNINQAATPSSSARATSTPHVSPQVPATTAPASSAATQAAAAPLTGISLPATGVATSGNVDTILSMQDVQDAVDVGAADFAALAPTTCSGECPSDDAHAPVPVTISSATPNSPTTTCSIVPKLAAPVVSDKALDVVMGDTSPTAAICLSGDLDNCTGNEDSVGMSLTPGSTPASFVAPQVIAAMVPHMCALMPKFNSPLFFRFTTVQGYGIHSDCTLLPWPSFKCSSFKTLLARQVLAEKREGFSSLGALHIQAATGWSHSHMLEMDGMMLLHPHGKLISSLTSITDNETSSPCVNWRLDNVLWKPSRWWPDAQCVRPANVALAVPIWPWITCQLAEVQFKCSYPLFLANSYFAKVPFLLSRRAEMTVTSNRGTSLNLAVYCGYPALRISHTCSWMPITVGYLLQYGLEADVLLLLVPGYINCSSSALLASLNGGAEVRHILQGNRRYSVLMKCSFSPSQLQSEIQFYTAEHILFICCALVQWKNPCAISGVSVHFWFQYCSAGLHGCEKFQWTIAWFLSNHSSLCSLQIRSPCAILLVQQNCPAIVDSKLSSVVRALRLDAAHKLLTDMPNVSAFVPWPPPSTHAGPQLIHGQYSFHHAQQKRGKNVLVVWALQLSLPPTVQDFEDNQGKWSANWFQVWQGDRPSAVIAGFDVPTSVWLQLAIKGSLGSPPELLSNSIVELKPWPSWEKLSCIAAVISSVGAFHMFCTLVILHHGKLHWLLGLHSSCDQFITERSTIFDCRYFEWHIPWDSCPVSGHWKLNSALLSSWDVSDWVHYLPSTRIMQCGINIHLPFSHLTWDPGGYTCRIGLRASRVLRRGDCQRPLSIDDWAGWVGHQLGPWPAWEPDAEEIRAHIYEESGHEGTWLGTGTDGLVLEGEDRIGLACVPGRHLPLDFPIPSCSSCNSSVIRISCPIE